MARNKHIKCIITIFTFLVFGIMPVQAGAMTAGQEYAIKMTEKELSGKTLTESSLIITIRNGKSGMISPDGVHVYGGSLAAQALSQLLDDGYMLDYEPELKKLGLLPAAYSRKNTGAGADRAIRPSDSPLCLPADEGGSGLYYDMPYDTPASGYGSYPLSVFAAYDGVKLYTDHLESSGMAGTFQKGDAITVTGDTADGFYVTPGGFVAACDVVSIR